MTALPHYGADPDILRLCVLVRSVLRERFTTLADLKEACASAIGDLSRKTPKHPWHYEGWQLDRAFEIVGASQPLVVPLVRRRLVERPGPVESPVPHGEARAILAQCKATVRGMPYLPTDDPRRVRRVLAQRQLPRPRVPLRQRLEAIFDGTES